jgi:DNA-binding transcriptional LysR family regulator
MASVPSIGQFVMPRVIARIRKRYTDLLMNIDILKIEEAIDYLLLRRGELVAVSYCLDHPGIRSIPLVEGELVAIVPVGHPLASRREVRCRHRQYPSRHQARRSLRPHHRRGLPPTIARRLTVRCGLPRQP